MDWYHRFERRVLELSGCHRWACLAKRMRDGEVSSVVLALLERVVMYDAPEPVVRYLDGEMVWGVKDESRAGETWTCVDYLDTRYPKTWFVARRMLTVATGA